MQPPKYPLRFSQVAEKLREWKDELTPELRDPQTHATALETKRQIEAALACLEFCEKHQVNPRARVIELPSPKTFGFSEYRICEDNESDQREDWTELTIEGERVWFYGGDMILTET